MQKHIRPALGKWQFSLVAAVLFISTAVNAKAERNNLKPSDFEALTSLPWKKPDATLEEVLDAIFREPDSGIRYAVLAEYLRIMPVARLGKAFDICIALEGTQTPDTLVEFFLPIWAKRDPKACWKRTKDLFRLVGMENGWLGYDSWKARSRITVQNLNAIRASRFWLGDRKSLMGFPLGVDESSLPREERIRLMKQFTDLWFSAFGSWPGYLPAKGPRNYSWGYSDAGSQLVKRFADTPDSSMMSHVGSSGPESEAEFEIALRRWLQAEPASALEIIKNAQGKRWPPFAERTEQPAAGPSIGLLIIWAKADLPAMIRWVASLDIQDKGLATRAKGFLMSRVDAETRERWLADAKPEDDKMLELLSAWAAWDPKPALDAAVATKDANTIEAIVDAVIYGPWGLAGFNTRHFGLGVVKDFDVAMLPKDIREAIRQDWAQYVMEPWGEIDISEAARHGLHFMLATDYAPRDRLMKFFSGKDEYPDEGGMIDRTFCALRVWAVVQPREMKTWIGTIKEADMRKALTWLLEHPWGTGPKE